MNKSLKLGGEDVVTRIKMKKSIAPVNEGNQFEAMAMDASMDGLIAETMYRAYKGGVDDEGETEKDYQQEIALMKDGLYGDWIPQASLVRLEDGEVIAGLFFCDFKGEPTLTYHFSLPEHQQRGHAKGLFHRAETILEKMGYDELYLYLSMENVPAYNMYDSLGFEETPIATEVEFEDPMAE